jgi:hypothetical protein
MLPRTTRLLILTLLFACVGGSLSRAQTLQRPPAEAVVRYHFGDDADGRLGWANPKFDDSKWPISPQGGWPMPPFHSNGFLWVRAEVVVPNHAQIDAATPLAIRTAGSLGRFGELEPDAADEVFVNGVKVGGKGGMPPHARPDLYGRHAVFDLPDGVVRRGEPAVVALRLWYPPGMCELGRSGKISFLIDERRNLHLALWADHLAALISTGPDLALNVIIFVLGAGLLVAGLRTHRRDLIFCGVMLTSMTLFALENHLYSLGVLPVSARVYSLLYVMFQSLSMGCTIEFIWELFALRMTAVKRLYQVAGAIFNGAWLVLHLANSPSTVVHWSALLLVPAISIFNVVQIGVNLWVLIARKTNRLIALAIISISVTVILSTIGIATESSIGPFYVSYFGMAFFLCEFGIFVMLGNSGWRAWRARDEFRFELDAAREVQQRIVTPAEDLPGFKLQSVYIPAKQVGGDFFRIVPEDDGGLLLVIGDVSGKGLRAAMTVSAIVGALRTLTATSPAEILNVLNRGLVGQLQGGFVTCCVARVSCDGSVTIANAGHLSPYLNGAEVALAAGLPLGLSLDAAYDETQFVAEIASPLTFISDGIVEARSATGELFGFDRTAHISNAGAEAIAQAAINFGQDDDITVLTLTRIAVEAETAAQLPAPAVLFSKA